MKNYPFVLAFIFSCLFNDSLIAEQIDFFVIGHDDLVTHYWSDRHGFDLDKMIEKIIKKELSVSAAELHLKESLRGILSHKKYFSEKSSAHSVALGSQYDVSDFFGWNQLGQEINKLIGNFFNQLSTVKNSYKESCLRPIFSFVVESNNEQCRLYFYVGHRCKEYSNWFSQCSSCGSEDEGIQGVGTVLATLGLLVPSRL